MKKIILINLLLFSFILANPIHPSLEKILAQISPADTVRVHVYLKSDQMIANFNSSLNQRQKIEYFKNAARASQEPLINYLNGQTDIFNLRCFWVANCLTLTTTKMIIDKIAQRSEVERIEENYLIYLEPFRIEEDVITTPPGLPIWNIRRIGAPEAWAAGYNGQGIVIGFIDTGVDANHPALKDNFTGFWFDPVNDSLNPYDDCGHGTHTVGTACGKLNIGVAPGAKFMMAKVFGSANNAATVEAIHRAFEWYAEMENPPEIISNSWGCANKYDLTFWQDILTIRSLGIIPVFSIGNGGTWYIGAPGNFPNVIAVGATTKEDSVTDWSSRGPAPSDTAPWNNIIYWPRSDWYYIKPNISGPGNHIFSSLPGGVYGHLSGTSMSCPNVAGCLAILLQKYPDLTFEEIYSILVDNASKVSGINFPNNDYGWGIVDAYKMLFQKENGPFYADFQVYPNPSRGIVNITGSFRGYQFVSAKIYDLTGRFISDLTGDVRIYGKHTYLNLYWRGYTSNYHRVAEGIYFIHLTFRQPDNEIKIFTAKFIFLKRVAQNK